MRLFVERARVARPGFARTDDERRAVARDLPRLDGIPLALELAAARVRVLSVEQIAARLDDRFRLLTGGPRTALPRQQTLRASIDWSHDLLTEPERALLRRLAVFAGGWTLEAAEAVCAGDGIERERVLDLLASLVDKSLVLAEERRARGALPAAGDGAPVRRERLAEAGEEDALRDRHRDHFLALAERGGLRTSRPGASASGSRCSTPRRPTSRRRSSTRSRSEPPLALRFCAALQRWWCARGRFAEAELAHSRSLDACGDREPALRARVLPRPRVCGHLRGRVRGGGSARDGSACARRRGRRRADRGPGALPTRCAVQYANPRGGASRTRARGRARPGGG